MRPETTTPQTDTLLRRYGLPPDEIEQLSLMRLEARAGHTLPSDPAGREVVKRVLYAAGDPDLAPLVHIHPDLVRSATAALRRGAPVVVDVRMVAAGLRHAALRELGCEFIVAIDEPGTAALVVEHGITRSAAGVRALAAGLGGALVAIGNAPTALLELLDLVDAGNARPAAIVGMPVGLVAAAESKDELQRRPIPYATVLGSRGGSPLAAAAVNALLDLALRDGDMPDGL